MKRKFILFLSCLFSFLAFAQVEDENKTVSIDWKEDSTEITTINDIIKVQQQLTSRSDTEKHFSSVWGRRGYFNFSYNNTKLSPKGTIETGVPDINGGVVPDFKSDWGASIQYGRSYRLHKKPIANVALFNIDYTGIDFNVNHFKAEGDGPYFYDSSKKFTKDNNSYYYTPWNMEKYEANYGMSLGPSLTVAPFNLTNSKALHFIKFNVFFHIGYHVSVLYMPNDKKADANTDENDEDHKAMESNLKLDWGHGLITSFGFNVSWKAIGIGYEMRNGNIKYKAANTGDFGKNEYEFKSATNRVYLQIRM